MYTDPVMDEIRKYRDDFSERFNGDTKAMLNDIRKRQSDSGRKAISRPPKRTATNDAILITEDKGTIAAK